MADAVIQATVTTCHSDYIEALPRWNRLADIMGGADKVKSNAQNYIPMTAYQERNPKQYWAMIERTPFINFFARTEDSIKGLIFRKNPMISVPDQYKVRLENINSAGDGIDIFTKKVTNQVITYGRVGILVDCMLPGEWRYSDAASLLPYLTIYNAFSITNWRVRTVDGRQDCDQVILKESYYEPREFGAEQRFRRKVYELDDNGDCLVKIYEPLNEGDYQLVAQIYPMDGRNKLRRIPFVVISTEDLSMNITKPPLLDLADANLSHFRLQNEYMAALHYTAHPTPVIIGLPEEARRDIDLGPGNALFLSEGATAMMLELRGAALTPLEAALRAAENHIMELGARLFQSTSTSAETASAVRIRQHSQTSVVSTIARTVSDGIQSALQIAVDWSRFSGRVKVELNQDFINERMEPQEMRELISAYHEGTITRRTLLYNFQQSEILEPGISLDDYEAELDRRGPILVGVPDLKVIAGTGKTAPVPPSTGGNPDAAPTTPPTTDRGRVPR